MLFLLCDAALKLKQEMNSSKSVFFMSTFAVNKAGLAFTWLVCWVTLLLQLADG